MNLHTYNLPPGVTQFSLDRWPAYCLDCGDPVDVKCSALCLNCLEALADEADGDLDKTTNEN